MKPRPRLRFAATLLAALCTAPCAAFAPVHAAELTLDDAVAIALKQSRPLAAATEGVAAAEATIGEANSWKVPHVELSETYTRTTNPVYVFMNLLGQESFGPANFDPNFLNRPPALGNFNTKVAVSQPLYAGGKIQAGAAAASYVADAAKADRERTRQGVVHSVVEAYSGAILAAQVLKVAEEGLATVKAHVKLVGDLREAGMVTESDVLQARVHQSEVEEQVVQARAAVAVARAGLNLALGRPLDTAFDLPAEIAPREAPAASLDALTAAATAQRSDLKAMDRRVEAAGAMVKAARAGVLPEVGVTGQYEMNKETFVGKDGSNWSVFVGAKWSAFDGGAARARTLRARAEQRAATQMNALLHDAAGLEVRQAWYALEAAQQRVVIATGAVAQARAALAQVEDRYKEGLATIVELMGAQTALSAARTREVAARRDVLLGRATLDLATGSLGDH